jgi:hypothetical protein
MGGGSYQNYGYEGDDSGSSQFTGKCWLLFKILAVVVKHAITSFKNTGTGAILILTFSTVSELVQVTRAFQPSAELCRGCNALFLLFISASVLTLDLTSHTPMMVQVF